MSQLLTSHPAVTPRTAAVSVVAVYRSHSADALFPLTVLVPWDRLRDVGEVDLTFFVPCGFQAEVVVSEPSYVLCSWSTARTHHAPGSVSPLVVGVTVNMTSDAGQFPFAVTRTNRAGHVTSASGRSGDPLTVEAYAALIPRHV